MIRFANLFTVIYAVLALIAAGNFGTLGLNYLDENIGYGLHPMLAFPICLLCLAMALMAPIVRGWYIAVFESEDDRYMREFSEMRDALRRDHSIHL